MASGILHIKDSYYFEVPKFVAPSTKKSREDFDDYWVRLDSDYQDWEAARQLDDVFGLGLEIPFSREELLQQYQQWRQLGANFGKPFDRFLTEAKSQAWFREALDAPGVAEEWADIKNKADNVEKYNDETPAWSDAKIADYNHQLSGKLLIPQPFGQLRNHYQMESGFGISKYMILLTVGAVVLYWLLRKVAQVLNNGRRTRLTNLIEVFLEFIRDQIAKPTIGHDYARFVPFLWTIFLFVLICNLMGMIPFLGAPTASFAVTSTLALTVICVTISSGIEQHGFFGFLKNLAPSLDLHWSIWIIIFPMIWVIELVGFLIKHAVLSVRLLANMVAGHLVLLALMGIAASAAGAASWYIAAPLSLFGALAIDFLELFVAFLQAYVFTFLSGLFIGAAIHHH